MITTEHFPTQKKIISWQNEPILPSTHTSTKPILVCGGCSFTDQRNDLHVPLAWPGYLVARCGFERAIDVSRTGAGNEYITTSILNQLEQMTDREIQDILLLIVWTGPNRLERLIDRQQLEGWEGYVDSVQFARSSLDPKNMSLDPRFYKGEVLRSWKNIVLLENYLKSRDIAFGFSFFYNAFDPPFLPRASTDVEFAGWLDKHKLQRLRQCSWLHDHSDSLYEYCFYQDLLSQDLFHPTSEGQLRWTDEILIPALVKRQFVSSLIC